MKVYIERNEQDYANMWKRWGWSVSDNPMNADVIQFTGGADVNPALYDEVPHPSTHFDRARDERCIGLYKLAVANGIAMCGICRGGQFLNVMNGGSMFQHCDGHAIYGVHKATILSSGLEVEVTSTHHQIMRPNRDKGIVLMEAKPLGTFKEHMVLRTDGRWSIEHEEEDDVEAVYYPDTNSLCFQGHPEYCGEDSSCVQAYKHCLRNYLNIEV